MARFITILFFSCLSANASEMLLTDKEVLKWESFRLSGNRGVVTVFVRNDGEALGHENMIELRPKCGKDIKSPTKLRQAQKISVVDVLSSCAVDASTLTFDPQAETVSIDITEVDADEYNRRTRENPRDPGDPPCTKNRRHVFSTAEICKRGSASKK